MAKKLIFLLLPAALILNACDVIIKPAKIHVPPGQIKKETTPGHMKKH